MTVEEFYAAVGGDYEGVLGRLRSEERLRKFAVKFLSDPSYEKLCEALKSENYDCLLYTSKTGRTSLFSGLVYCPDCGAKLHFSAAKSMTRN